VSSLYERGIDAFLGLVNLVSVRTGVDVGHLMVYGLLFLIALSVLGRRG
jgi:hypothetical protein